MCMWNWLFGEDMAPATSDNHAVVARLDVNPATGLPMIGDFGALDVGGNPYGTDWQTSSYSDAISNFDGGGDPGAAFGDCWPD